ncbi:MULTISPECIES: MlaD family protein [unclassified Rhodococcus (in: high G+C Gram-positive bacteria)]|uniref:MlaD family protein n=1 Tax=unclassified Rhodococcus (in: high G+C Gram-positive bacteria) TaxID=192944 RepID=UPI001639B79C|nr:MULTISPECIES: MlaD family protein [unclassified Rhodococcus (in: high G+C Gram-positive bacteria)]MBC2639487.1 MCE family protein [Rhodococcus sp. 3A]MBC2895768.1 MCE family protein [Rhodococcus sp. 4CII]
MTVKTQLSIVGMVVIAVLSFLYMGRAGLHVSRFDDVRTATLDVPDTNGLVVGSRVLLRGVAIGHISDMTTSADHIEVAWNYENGRSIPADSAFRVDNLSALGEPYLAVLPSSNAGPYLEDGATVPASQVVVPTTFKELSERLTRLLEQVDPERVQSIFDTIDVALPDDFAVLNNLNRAGELLAATLSQQSDTLTTLFDTLQPLLMDSATVPEGFRGTTPIVAEFGSGFHDVLGGIRFATEKGPLRDGIANGASPFIGELQTFLDHTAPDLQVIGVNLLPSVQAGAAAMRTVDVGRLLDNVMAATTSGDALTVHLSPSGR